MDWNDQKPVMSSGHPIRLQIAVAVQALDTLGGKERDALAIAANLTLRGHEVTILTRSAKLAIPPHTRLREVSADGWTNHGRARLFARNIAKLSNAIGFDVLLSFEKLKDADAYYAADVCFAGRTHGLKTWLPRYATYISLERECMTAGGPDILFLCNTQAQDYCLHYPLGADRAITLPPMIHDAGRQGFYERRTAIREKFGIPESAKLAAAVAVYAHQKGVDRTVAALRDIPGLYFLAVGLKDTAEATALATHYGIAERIRFVGYSDEVADILGAADLMLHPARLENTGLVILESLIAGVPVIASAVCGFAEYVERFGAGTVLREPFNATGYVAAIRAALEPERLDDFQRRARNSADQLRSEGGLDRIVDVIELVLQRRAATRTASESGLARADKFAHIRRR